MSTTDEILKANETYAENFTGGELPLPPARKLAVVACMDARLIVSQILGLKAGDAHIIRDAGGIVTEDALRSPDHFSPTFGHPGIHHHQSHRLRDADVQG